MKTARKSILKIVVLIIFLSLSVSGVSGARLFEEKNRSSGDKNSLSNDNFTKSNQNTIGAEMAFDLETYKANYSAVVNKLQLVSPVPFSGLIKLNQDESRKSQHSLRRSEIQNFISKMKSEMWRVGGYMFDNRLFIRTELMQFSDSMKYLWVEYRIGDEGTQIVIARMEYANSFRENLNYNVVYEENPRFEIQSIIAITSGVNIPQYLIKTTSQINNQDNKSNSEKKIARMITDKEKDLIRETMALRAISLIQKKLPQGNSNQEANYFKEMSSLKEYYNFDKEVSFELKGTGYGYMMSGKFIDELNVTNEQKSSFIEALLMLNQNESFKQNEKELSRSIDMEMYIICIPDEKSLYFVRLEKTSEYLMNAQTKYISVEGVLPQMLAFRTSVSSTWNTVYKTTSKQFPDHFIIKNVIDAFIGVKKNELVK